MKVDSPVSLYQFDGVLDDTQELQNIEERFKKWNSRVHVSANENRLVVPDCVFGIPVCVSGDIGGRTRVDVLGACSRLVWQVQGRGEEKQRVLDIDSQAKRPGRYEWEGR
jgi:hypothetical protein